MSKTKKMNAFMLNDIIKFNIDELVTFIEDNYPSVDISNIRKSYIYVEPNGNNLWQWDLNKLAELKKKYTEDGK